MRSPAFLARRRAQSYLVPKRPEREWPAALLIIGVGIAVIAAAVAIALEAGK